MLMGFPDSSGKEAACHAGDPSLIPRSGRSGEGICYPLQYSWTSLVAQLIKTCKVGDLGLIPGLGRSPGEGSGYPLQYSGLENPMDKGVWQATVHGVAKSQTWLNNFHFHFSKMFNILENKSPPVTTVKCQYFSIFFPSPLLPLLRTCIFKFVITHKHTELFVLWCLSYWENIISVEFKDTAQGKLRFSSGTHSSFWLSFSQWYLI